MNEVGSICSLTDKLVEAALEKGGRDNVTVIAVQVYDR